MVTVTIECRDILTNTFCKSGVHFRKQFQMQFGEIAAISRTMTMMIKADADLWPGKGKYDVIPKVTNEP